jgi:ethanolamine ammonia-lyase small subunit
MTKLISPDDAAVSQDPWQEFRTHTDARIALGRAGNSVPTTHHLSFQAAHAQARDAVHTPLDKDAMILQLTQAGWPSLLLSSAAADRAVYLKRPDLGRRLSESSIETLSQPRTRTDVVLVVADGLSSIAVAANAVPTLQVLVPMLLQIPMTLAPILVATQARVALGDPIGELFQAKIAIVLIGERPGLSAADSMGMYLTWMPRPGRVDSERNCISNIRTQGLAPTEAARQAADLVKAMIDHQAAGVLLGQRRSQ